MEYIDLTSEQLPEQIKEIEILNSELLVKQQETRLELNWACNLGHWY